MKSPPKGQYLQPYKVVCLAFNYLDLTEGEKKPPLIFFKPSTAIIKDRQHIRIPKRGGHVWPEVELAVRIGRTCRNVSARRAHRYISGYAVANDVTMMAEHDVHLAASKGRDTFLPLGEWHTGFSGTNNLEMTALVNGKVIQKSTTSLRIYDEFKAIEYISKVCTLLPGDIVLTGTPAHHHHRLKAGDRVCVRVGNMEITNPVSRG